MVISWCLKDCLLNMSSQGYCSANRRASSLAQKDGGMLGRGHMFRTVLSVIACSSFSSCYLSHMWRPMSQIFIEIVSSGRLGSDLLYRLCLGVLGMFRRVWRRRSVERLREHAIGMWKTTFSTGRAAYK